MSIITTVEAVPNRMRDIFNYVAESKKPIQRDNLRALFMPPSKRRNESTAVFDSTLKECLNIGLLIDDDGLVNMFQTFDTTMLPRQLLRVVQVTLQRWRENTRDERGFS